MKSLFRMSHSVFLYTHPETRSSTKGTCATPDTKNTKKQLFKCGQEMWGKVVLTYSYAASQYPEERVN